MDGPIVTLSDGKIQGAKKKSVLGMNYLAFKGIPYAQPPIGPLRFKAPQAVTKWSGVRDASKHAGGIAMQHKTDGPKPYPIIGSEDCLYLNVYTNTIGHKRPVLVFIHGGNLIEGTGNDCIYGEDYLVTMDMVLVSVNFRLGPMGFLNLGHEVAAGNQGLRDIICALKWVQLNIEQFGGDPNNVTICGHSSGSIKCHLLTLLPAAKGLVHKAILQSCTALVLKSLVTGKDVFNGFRIAKLLGMDSQDPEEVIEFLRGLPAEKLIELEGKIVSKAENMVECMLEYSLTYDAPFTKDPLVPKLLPDLLKNNSDIPIIIGNTINECLLWFMGQFDNLENYKFYNDNIEKIAKNWINLEDDSRFPEAMKTIRKFYLHDKEISEDNIWNIVNLMTDLVFVNCSRKVVDIRNEHANAPTYLYYYSYTGDERTIYQYDQGPQPIKGVAHGDELSYLFYLSYMKKDRKEFPREGTRDRMMLERLLRMWYNFVATGNPTPTTDDRYLTTIWLPSTKDELHYLDIGAKLELKDERNLANRAIYEGFAKI